MNENMDALILTSDGFDKFMMGRAIRGVPNH